MTPIEEYIATCPKERQLKLNELYQTIKNIVPDATEKIAYGMPTFYLHGNLVHFANAKKHIGFYPTPSAITTFQAELVPYKTSKGAIQFPVTEELPIDLIEKIVAFRVQENLKK
ncbi:iron chaperone [Enterococcus rivorum]|uniref:YdhG-like domain-containing protein n=1 Tax=Enterococcus rivorum TaxID=762845 RepID=A0A1E5L025_9ENTE|nr:DUF1801 domain-containing protein [Enterococcus rivorum]MBP2099214.1 uncharacterized protein YdhG (YjbR/CyaY superfamily) [Enterococcus rivorum]OEH83466.1 hypothetical protein BCR26_09155 [Enterococcus rivorum]